MKQSDKSSVLFLIFVLALVLVSVSPVFPHVKAQNTATVTVIAGSGGTTDITGTNTYPDGTSFTITAIPSDNGHAFFDWIITSNTATTNSIENPLTITLAGGTTYNIQSEFAVIQAPPGGSIPGTMTNAAIVIVLAGAGGTTSPAAGTYAMADATTMQLKATPNSGWQFSHWTICGSSMSHGDYPLNYAPTDNPYTVGHGYNYTYYYQPVFTQIASNASPTPSTSTSATSTANNGLTTNTLLIAVLVIIIIVMAIGMVVLATRRR